MKAVVKPSPDEKVMLQDVPEPMPGPQDVVVEIKASGLCATDLDIAAGKMPIAHWPIILGHQAAGVVKAKGEKVNGNVAIGDRVVCTIDITCGACRYCRIGASNLCKDVKRMSMEYDGSHAEFIKVPACNVLSLPDNIPFEEGAVLLDAVASMYHCLVKLAHVRPGQKVVLLGIGGMGIQGIQIAHMCGASVLVTSRQDKRLRFARELGAEVTVNTRRDDLVQAVSDFTAGEGADVVVDSIGLSWTMEKAVELLRRGGKAMIIGLKEPSFSAPYLNMCVQEKQIIGSRSSTKQDVAEVIELVKIGKLKPVVSQRFPLNQFNLAFTALGNDRILGRGVLVP